MKVTRCNLHQEHFPIINCYPIGPSESGFWPYDPTEPSAGLIIALTLLDANLDVEFFQVLVCHLVS